MKKQLILILSFVSMAIVVSIFLKENDKKAELLSENIEVLSRRDTWFDLETCYYLGIDQQGDVILCPTYDSETVVDKCPYPCYVSFSGTGRCYK